jgi:flavin reductase (DIM6/NTAB) family NADH-FMN oxidoreductase RutF
VRLPLDPAAFRTVVGHFPSGVTVMTTASGDRLHGMTVSAFASVSLQPLLVLVSIERSTVMHRLVLESRRFAISILDERSEATARFFADNARLDGEEFRPGSYRLGTTGAPILGEAIASLEATISRTMEAGDHTIIVGEVVGLEILGEGEPLIYFRGGYRRLD